MSAPNYQETTTYSPIPITPSGNVTTLENKLLWVCGMVGMLVLAAIIVLLGTFQKKQIHRDYLNLSIEKTHHFAYAASVLIRQRLVERLDDSIISPLHSQRDVLYAVIYHENAGETANHQNPGANQTALPAMTLSPQDWKVEQLDSTLLEPYTGKIQVRTSTLNSDVIRRGSPLADKGETGYDVLFELPSSQQDWYLRVGFSHRPIERQLNELFLLLGGFGLVLVGVMMLSVLLITKRVIRPINRLTEEVAKVHAYEDEILFNGPSGVSAQIILKNIRPEAIVSSTREVENLKNTFIRFKNHLLSTWNELRIKNDIIESMNINLESEVEARTEALNKALVELREKAELTQAELDVASDIQKGILPQSPMRFNGINIVSFFQPMDKVGGDFYDVFRMKGGRLGVLIADVSGHGIPAALVTVMAKICFKDAAYRHISPREIFMQVNETMFQTVKTMEYLTAFMIVINPDYRVAYGKASHQVTLVYRHQQHIVEEWDTNGVFLGVFGNKEVGGSYKEVYDRLGFGDRVLLFTDGLTDIRNRNKETLGQERLKELLLETATVPLEKARDTMVETWRQYAKQGGVNDDTTFLLMEVDPAYQELLKHRDNGRKHLHDNEFDLALEALSLALSIDHTDPLVHRLLGQCYRKTHRFAKAVEHLQVYLDSHHGDADALYLQADAYFSMEKYDEAVHYAKAACQLRPNFVKGLQLWGLALKEQGMVEEADHVKEMLFIADPLNEMVENILKSD